MHRVKLTCPGSGVTVRVVRYRDVYEVRDEGGEYLGFLDRRSNPISGRSEYRAAGCSDVWHGTIREAVSELLGGMRP
jgi:hypothetical protein